MILDEHLQLKQIQININSSIKNIKLHPIKEINDILEDSDYEDEVYLLAEKKELP